MSSELIHPRRHLIHAVCSAGGRPHAAGQPGQLIEYWQKPEAQARRLYELKHSARTSLLVFQSGANTVAPAPSTLVTSGEAAADADADADADAENEMPAPPSPGGEPSGVMPTEPSPTWAR
ncbi:hypothetical protein [Streptomyces sp. 840.1]|uniref:hypothetical protein n=1 Tax=Streptomyces sp. 840.1 TaxID=2485152 RepID=UPI001C842947|nr:hypothetical protein [Streptomyces sp. 840.1]